MNFLLFSGGKQVTDKILLRRFMTDEVGIFESLRTYRGKIFRVEEHLERFMESAKTAGFRIPFTLQQLHRELNSAVKNYSYMSSRARHKFGGRGDLKSDLPAGQAGIASDASRPRNDGISLFIRLTVWSDQIFVMIGERKHAESFYQKGVKLKTSPVRRSLSNAAPPQVKTSAYQNAVLASLEPKSEEIYEWIFLDQNGFVTEVRIGNLFIIKKIVGARHAVPLLLTPPEPGILNGVTRRFVIECTARIGIPVKETPLTRHEIFNADEAFLTNTSWEILPVAELDGRRIGSGVPGPVTLKLRRTFKQKITEEYS